MNSGRYEQRGVSASKEDVHSAIKNIDKGIFPGAFCKIIPDYLGTPTAPAPSRLSHTPTGAKQAIWTYGKASRRTP